MLPKNVMQAISFRFTYPGILKKQLLITLSQAKAEKAEDMYAANH